MEDSKIMLDESKIVIVDIDEVMWKLLDPWVYALDSKYFLNVKPEDCMAWDMRLLFPTLTYEQILEPLETPGFWSNLEPLPGAQEYIAKLQEMGMIVKVVTATSYKSAVEKIPTLLKHFPTINKKDIILCEQKEYVRGDFHIDDNINYLLHRKHPILMEAHHNKCILVPDHMVKVSNWEQVYEYIKNTVGKA